MIGIVAGYITVANGLSPEDLLLLLLTVVHRVHIRVQHWILARLGLDVRVDLLDIFLGVRQLVPEFLQLLDVGSRALIKILPGLANTSLVGLLQSNGVGIIVRRHAFLIEMIETLQAEQVRASEDEAIEMALARSLEEGHGSGGGGGGGSSGRSYSGSYSVQRGGDGGGGVSVALLEQVLPSVPFSDARGFLLHDEADADETDGADGGIECAVCLLNFADDDAVRLLPCVHVFHARCIDNWFARKTACPTCKQPVALG